MQALANDMDLAKVSGINIEKVIFWTWVITEGLTALGVAMYGLICTIKPIMG
jgi:neutral amino acid transport system permease protein